MATRAEIEQIYQTILGRAPDAGGLDYWASQLSGYSLADAARAIATAAAGMSLAGQTPELQQAILNAQRWLSSGAVYTPPTTAPTTTTPTTTTPTTTTPTATTTTPTTTTTTTPSNVVAQTTLLVASVYRNVLGKEPDAEGLKYWSEKLAGQDLGTITDTIANIAAQVQGATPQDVAAAQQANTYVKAQQALQSPKLTREQYNDLAAYFGNTFLPQDTNQINDFVGKKSGFEFANYVATRDPSLGGTGDKNAQIQQLQKLIVPLTSKPIEYYKKPQLDSETNEPTRLYDRYAINPITGQEEKLVPVGEGRYAFQFSEIGRANDDPNKTGYFPQLILEMSPTEGTAKIVAANPYMGKAGGGSSLLDLAKVAAPLAIGAAFPGLGTSLGASILGTSASTAAQAALGDALLGGLTTGAITGDLEKSLIAAALAGAGTYAIESGALGDVFDSLNLGEFKDTFGIKNSTQLANIGDVEAQAGNFYGNTKNAVYDQATGITSLFNDDGTLRALAVDSANNPFNLEPGTYSPAEFQGMLSTTSTGNLPNITPETQKLLDSTISDNFGSPNYTKDPNAPPSLGEAMGIPQAAGSTSTPDSLKNYLAELGVIPVSAGGASVAASLLNNVGDAAGLAKIVQDALKSITDTTSSASSGLLENLLGAGIDYAKLNELQNLANEQGQKVRQEATAAGQLANIPFTPYTVTSGAGTTAFGTDAAGRPTATVSSSPEYQALRQQALAQAGQAYGAINPATATQDYYANLQALQAPGQQIAQEQLLSNLASKGLLGIGRNLPTVGQAGTSAVNPYMQSLLAAQREADLKNAIASQQYGLQQAQGQAQLAGTLLGQGQNIDTAALQTLAQGAGLGQMATQLNQAGAARQLAATLGGQDIGSKYDIAALNAQAQALGGAGSALKGLLGLPTTAGNTSSSNLAQQAINYLGGLFS